MVDSTISIRSFDFRLFYLINAAPSTTRLLLLTFAPISFDDNTYGTVGNDIDKI